MAADGTIREATPADAPGIVAVAVEHGFSGAETGVDASYRAFVASHGRLVVAAVDGGVVGFGGAIDAGGIRLVTDLFVAARHQGRGLGGRMLHALVGDAQHRMTFSSSHERAVPAYARMEMLPRWQLRYWFGLVPAAGGRHAFAPDEPELTEVRRSDWLGDRPDLVDHWSATGRLVHLRQDGRLVGWSIAVPTIHRPATWTITRLVTEVAHDAALVAMLRLLPEGDGVLVSTPDRSTAGAVLDRLGFDCIDSDVFCATDGIDVPTSIAVLHPGLG